MASRKEREAEELRRRKVARRRFKTLVRLVMYNRTWLLDMEEQHQITTNVKKNIAMVIRPPRKFGLLTVTDKSLLRTHPYVRTVKDRKHLVSLFAHLTCFSSFSPRVRARLVPVMTFLDLQRNRTIVREGAMPQMVYFIIYGEVEVYRKKFDPMTQSYEPKLLGMLGTGDCVGEMEFIENKPERQSTAITASDTELLVIQEEDFERILKPLMVLQWEERKTALRALQYFSFFTEEQLESACKYSVLRQFNALETIYYEDKGLASYAYFIVSGECMILQCLKIKTKQKDGVKTYELFNVEQGSDVNIFENMSEKEIMKLILEEKKAMETSETTSNDDDDPETTTRPAQVRPVINIEALCAAKGPVINKNLQPELVPLEEVSSEKFASFSDKLGPSKDEEGKYESITDSSIELEDSIYKFKTSMQPQTSEKINTIPEAIGADSKKASLDVEKAMEDVGRVSVRASQLSMQMRSPNSKILSFKENESLQSNAQTTSSETVTKSHISTKSSDSEEDLRTENHFIDVGAMTFGGIFGLGEKIEHRVIMARTTVQCLMIPRFFLLEKEQNPGNIWQRRRFYLDCTIPSRQDLFKNFLATLKWQKFKTDLIQDVVREKLRNNATKVEDVPVMCRITEEG